MKSIIQQKAKELFPKLQAIRHHIHRNPELSFQEYETTKYIASQLDELGITYSFDFADTGLVAELRGKNPERKTIALRADIDALPILEENDVPYKSQKDGLMHACGHDVHTTNLIGAASILNELKDEFEGTIRLIFQPGEEQLPGGASLMIEAGVLENPSVQSIIGQHVPPPLAVGKIGLKPGQYMASADEIHLTITGTGGHAALVDDYLNPIPRAAQLILDIRKAVMEAKAEDEQTVLAFGDFRGHGATNVIPEKVRIMGTFRSLNEDWRFRVHDIIKDVVARHSDEFQGQIELVIPRGYPSLFNDVALTNKVKSWAIDYMGEENVVDLPLRMTGEDFSFYTHKTAGCFYRLGTGNEERGITAAVHQPTFDIDEAALIPGAGLMAYLAIMEVNN